MTVLRSCEGIVAKHRREGWVVLRLELRDQGPGFDVEHNHVPHRTEFSASGSIWYRRNSPDCHTAGQMLYVLKDPDYGPIPPWTRRDLASVHKLWLQWHLNAMTAGCAHMTLPPSKDYAARNHLLCEAGTGYQYGRAWLYKPIPDDAMAEMTRLMDLLQISEPWPRR